MLRYSNVLWLSCALGITLGGCTAAKDYSNAPKGNVDRYYGSPQSGVNRDTQQHRVTPASHSNKPVWEALNYSTRAIQLKPNAPKRYVVKKGDTLWDIAKVYLKDPAQWPRLWSGNRSTVKNPNLIYPGDVLHLEQIKVAAERIIAKPHMNPRTIGYLAQSQGGAKHTFRPRLRIEKRGDRAGTPLHALGVFTVWPKVLTHEHIKQSPYVVSSRDRSLLITEGERVYVKNMRGAQLGQRYAVYHPESDLRDPDTGRVLGKEVSYSGEIRLDRIDRLSSATVSKSRKEIHNGDRILPHTEETINLATNLKAPNRRVRGTVVSLFDANLIQGTHMVAVINRGRGHGMQPGYILGVYDEGQYVKDPLYKEKDKYGRSLEKKHYLPPEKVANLIIYKVDNNLSYGVVMDASRSVQNGYKIGNP